MKSKILLIPGENTLEKVSCCDFLFPLDGFCVGMDRTFSLENIPDHSYIYVNRLLDSRGIEEFVKLLPLFSKKVKGIVFEDLGILNVLKENSITVETIFYGTHGVCSSYTANSLLNDVDTVILSNDITKEEIDEILERVTKKVGLMIFGHLPYMYSRRTLLTNYSENFKLEKKKKRIVKEQFSKQGFLVVEDEFGTMFYDPLVFDGRVLLNKDVSYFLVDLRFEHVSSIKQFMQDFLTGNTIPNTTDGFLYRKTIYRLPPKGGV